MLVVDAAREECLVAQCVEKAHTSKFDFIGYHHYRVAHQLVSGVQRGDGGLAVYNQLTCQIDVV